MCTHSWLLLTLADAGMTDRGHDSGSTGLSGPEGRLPGLAASKGDDNVPDVVQLPIHVFVLFI
jgi:hypothetical protein